jgi:hypothetical protein
MSFSKWHVLSDSRIAKVVPESVPAAAGATVGLETVPAATATGAGVAVRTPATTFSLMMFSLNVRP